MARLQTPIRRNDTVLVTAGKDRGKRGRVLKVLPDTNRLVVEGVNFVSRHTRPNPGKNIKGGIMKREAPLHASNVQVVCPECGKQTTHRPPHAGRRPQGPHLPQVRGSRRQMSRVKERYLREVVPALMKEFGYTNVMAVPRITKVVINMGIGEATKNAKIADTAQDELGRIAGQRAVVTRARKSIAQFKLRQGMPVGAMVTLRGERMYEFLDRLISIALPRVRDFRACRPRASTAAATSPLGLRDQLLFPGNRLHEGRQGAGHERVGDARRRGPTRRRGSCSS